MQEYLIDLDRQFKTIKDDLIDYMAQSRITGELSDNEEIDGIDNELRFQLLQGHIQSIISDRIEGIKKLNDNFGTLFSKLDFLIKTNEFTDGKKLIEMNTRQIQSYIEETDKQIENILGKEKLLEDNNIFNLYVRPYINKFNNSKDILINELKNFIQKGEDKLHLNQIKYYSKISNPIKLNLLSKYLEINTDQLKEIILDYINRNKLNAKIANNELSFERIESEITDSKDVFFFKNIKTIGNELYLNFKLTNPSNFDLRDFQISLKVPNYVNIQKKESFPKYLQLNELKPGSAFKFNYVCKIDKQKELKKNLFDASADEIKLELFYRDQFNNAKKTTKHIDLFIP
jgi:hypothetical protein